MRVFQVKGFTGALLLILGVIGIFAVAVALPSTFMMVLWNALIFEGLEGPEITLLQGFLLWAMVLIILNLILKPQISFQVHRATELRDSKKTDRDK